MAEELNMHFSSVSTREDTSSLPVPETKFKGSEWERLGQLVVTPEVVASKINNMKENKSPGVDGISPTVYCHLRCSLDGNLVKKFKTLHTLTIVASRCPR